VSLYSVVQSDALDWLKSLPDNHADLCVTSPPYTAARTYGIGAARNSTDWVAWLRPIIVEACRVCRIVALNCSDQVKGGKYQCGDLWLIADLTRLDGLAMGPMPYAWVRNGIAGSGGKHYHRRDWEPVYVLARPENLPPAWSDNKAFGKPPKYGPGGEMSYRLKGGSRRNQFAKIVTNRRQNGERRGKPETKRRTDGSMEVQVYVPPAIANAGNVIRTTNGGGQLGSKLAHENEAPMNMALAERFVCWYCPPGGRVIDIFSGSGTTGHAAIQHGRTFEGCDVRESQVELTKRRLAGVTPGMF
jgi:hypothetical protein